jgi:hypothetical protein
VRVTCCPTIFSEKGGSMKVRYGAVLPLPPQEAFAFVADAVNWPLFFPGVRCVAKDDDWAGSVATLVSRVSFLAGPRRWTSS